MAASTSGRPSSSSFAAVHQQLLARPGCRGSSSLGRRRVVVTQARGSRGDRRKPPPPDLPSLLFDQRIVYLGMPVRALCLCCVACVNAAG
jgi:hypothetical protein